MRKIHYLLLILMPFFVLQCQSKKEKSNKGIEKTSFLEMLYRSYDSEINVSYNINEHLSQLKIYRAHNGDFFPAADRANRFDMEISRDTVKNIKDSLLLTYIAFLNQNKISITNYMEYSASYSSVDGTYDYVNFNDDSIKLTFAIHEPFIGEIDAWKGNCKYYISVEDPQLNGKYILDTTRIECYTVKLNH